MEGSMDGWMDGWKEGGREGGREGGCITLGMKQNFYLVDAHLPKSSQLLMTESPCGISIEMVPQGTILLIKQLLVAYPEHATYLLQVNKGVWSHRGGGALRIQVGVVTQGRGKVHITQGMESPGGCGHRGGGRCMYYTRDEVQVGVVTQGRGRVSYTRDGVSRWVWSHRGGGRCTTQVTQGRGGGGRCITQGMEYPGGCGHTGEGYTSHTGEGGRGKVYYTRDGVSRWVWSHRGGRRCITQVTQGRGGGGGGRCITQVTQGRGGGGEGVLHKGWSVKVGVVTQGRGKMHYTQGMEYPGGCGHTGEGKGLLHKRGVHTVRSHGKGEGNEIYSSHLSFL